MDWQYTRCRVSCHRCNHEGKCMGKQRARIGGSRKPVKTQCPGCDNWGEMNPKNAG